MADSGTAGVESGSAGQADATIVTNIGQEGAVIGDVVDGEEGESQAAAESSSLGILEVRECGIQAGALDEYAEYFECFLKIGDCLPKIIVCGGDDEMPRIVVCEGMKRKPIVNATEETKKVLQEIQKQIAEMMHVVQVNTILREEINHIEGECPVIKLKQVVKRINATIEPEEPPVTPISCRRGTCGQVAENGYHSYSSKSEIRNSSFRSSQSSGQPKSKVSPTDIFQTTCPMCLKQTQPAIGGCCCNVSAGTRQQPPASTKSQGLSRGSDIFTDSDIKSLIEKCLGPPCNTCEADKYEKIMDELDMEATQFSQTGQKIYDILVPSGYKDSQGWGGNHKVESILPLEPAPCYTQKYAETVEELKGELSKLDQLEDVLLCGDNMFNNREGTIGCESTSCINAASYLNNQIAQIEQDLNVLRTCLERARKERKVLETQQTIFRKPLCYN